MAAVASSTAPTITTTNTDYDDSLSTARGPAHDYSTQASIVGPNTNPDELATVRGTVTDYSTVADNAVPLPSAVDRWWR